MRALRKQVGGRAPLLYCLQCTNLERAVHWKLGGWPEGLTPEEKKQFFQDTAKQLPRVPDVKPGPLARDAAAGERWRRVPAAQRVGFQTLLREGCAGQQVYKEHKTLVTYNLEIESVTIDTLEAECHTQLLERESALQQRKNKGKKGSKRAAPAAEGEEGSASASKVVERLEKAVEAAKKFPGHEDLLTYQSAASCLEKLRLFCAQAAAVVRKALEQDIDLDLAQLKAAPGFLKALNEPQACQSSAEGSKAKLSFTPTAACCVLGRSFWQRALNQPGEATQGCDRNSARA